MLSPDESGGCPHPEQMTARQCVCTRLWTQTVGKRAWRGSSQYTPAKEKHTVGDE